MIIAFTGKKGSGKTTACNALRERYNVKQLNFKDGLIKELRENFPDLLRVIVEDYNDAGFGPTELTLENIFDIKPSPIRTLMQNYGTEVRRKDDPDYWVMQWKTGLVDLMNTSRDIVVTDDVRFKNEAEAVRAYGGIIIRLNRIDMESTDGHVSEIEQDEIIADYTIETGAGMQDELARRLYEIVEAQ